MEKLHIEICACNRCVMMGAMDIRENIESLRSLKEELHLTRPVELTMEKRICKELGDDVAPVVSIDHEMMTNATTESVMEKVIELAQRK